MRERHLRRHCRALLRELNVPAPFGPRELCRRLSEHRGREIRLMPFPIEAPGPFGLWLSTDTADLVIYQSQTTRSHQEHIILHELGHIIAGHEGEAVEQAPGPELRGLPRSAYDNRQEREAELIATILHEWAGRSDGLGAEDRENAPETAVLDRIGHAIAHGGWS
jgi:hypothetical protein